MKYVGILNKKSCIKIITGVFDIYVVMSVGNNMFDSDERDRQFKLIKVLKQIVIKFVEDDYTVKMDKTNVCNINKLNKLLRDEKPCKCPDQGGHSHKNEDSSSSSDDE